MKQVIVMRKDLKMRRGKEIAQGAHASIAFLSNRIRDFFGLADLLVTLKSSKLLDPLEVELKLSAAEKDWILGSFKKICVAAQSEEELLAIHAKAEEANLVVSLIQDDGKTEFQGKPTYTCLAIGPDDEEAINKITGELKLY